MEDYSKFSDDELIKMYNEAKHQSNVYNVSQLVKKILLNSLYGAVGNNYFRYYNKNMAMSITKMGQCMINKAALKKNQYIGHTLGESGENIKDRRIYSDTDSVVASTKIYVNNNYIPISEFYDSSLGDEYCIGDEKYIKELSPEYTTKSISDNNIIDTDIIYVMKHKVKKNLYKIKVDGKEVIVTEDHSIVYIHDGVLVQGTVKTIQKGDKIVTIEE